MAEKTVAVIGLGLIGGSLAKDLAWLGHRVLGHDRDPATLKDALAQRCVHAALGAGYDGIQEADVVVLAVPVGSAPQILRAAAPKLRARLVTDVGSTKRSIVAAAEAAGIGDRFVGSHPMAGDHRAGLAASRTGLFREARVYLCPTDDTTVGAMEEAGNLWRTVGAEPRVVGAEEHDTRMAWVSHLPQAASSALALSLAGSGLGADAMGPGGRDATRLAASPAVLWADILLENADLVEPALASLEVSVAGLRGAVRRRDRAALERMLEGARAWKEGLGRPAIEGAPGDA